MDSSKEVEYRVTEKLDEQDRLLRRAWYMPRSEALHRVGGPAVEVVDPITGTLIEEISLNQFDPWPPKRVDIPRIASAKEVEYRVIEKLDEQERLLRRTWHAPRTGPAHRVGGPAIEEFEQNSGKLIGEIWINQFRHGKHRDDNLPSEISIDPVSGIVVREEFYRDNRHHRDDGGPTEIYRDNSTGHVTMLIFSYEGWRDRKSDLAAVQEFSEKDGRLLREEFYSLGHRHRERGPAIIDYDVSGNPIPSSLQYYRRGNKLSGTAGFTPPGP